jgi:hypothetical protein
MPPSSVAAHVQIIRDGVVRANLQLTALTARVKASCSDLAMARDFAQDFLNNYDNKSRVHGAYLDLQTSRLITEALHRFAAEWGRSR